MLAPLAALDVPKAGPAAGGAIAAGVRWRALSLLIEARAILRASSDATIRMEGDKQVRVDGSAQALLALPCARLGPVFGCAIAGVERVTVTGEVAHPRQDAGVTWTAGARLGGHVALSSRVGLEPFVDLVFRGAPDVNVDMKAATPAPLSTVSGDLGIATTFVF